MRTMDEGTIKEKIISLNDFLRVFVDSTLSDLIVNYWIPKNCLHLSCKGDEIKVVVMTEKKTAPATYYDRRTGDSSGYILPYPGLLFYIVYNAENGTMQKAKVFAVKENVSNPDLYVFPYSNVYNDGSICFGGNTFRINGDRLDLAVNDVEEMFYSAPYNGDLYNMTKTGFLCKSMQDLFKKLDGKNDFPDDMLVPLTIKLTDIIE